MHETERQNHFGVVEILGTLLGAAALIASLRISVWLIKILAFELIAFLPTTRGLIAVSIGVALMAARAFFLIFIVGQRRHSAHLPEQHARCSSPELSGAAPRSGVPAAMLIGLSRLIQPMFECEV